MNYLLFTPVATVAPSIGVLSALIAILIGQRIDEKKHLKESHLLLLVVSIAILITILLTVALGALFLAVVGVVE